MRSNQIPFFVLLLLAFACTKPSSHDETINNGVSETKSSSRTASEDNIASQLMHDYGLRELTSEEIGSIQFPSYSNYNDAASYINSIQQEINQVIVGDASSEDDSVGMALKPLPPYDDPTGDPCGSAGTYHSVLHNSAGFLSNFNVYFNNIGGGIGGATVYATGTPIGWGWSQLGTSFAGGYSGCVFGTITYGLQIGNITIGLTQDYHFSFSFDPSRCMVTYTQGSGRCDN